MRNSFQLSEGREKDKPLHLPQINKSIENSKEEINAEYQDIDVKALEPPTNDARSLASFSNSKGFREMSLSNRKRTAKKKPGSSKINKSQISRKKTNPRKQYWDLSMFNNGDITLNEYMNRMNINQN